MHRSKCSARLADSGRSKARDESNETLDAMRREDDSAGSSELVAKRRSCLFVGVIWVGEL